MYRLDGARRTSRFMFYKITGRVLHNLVLNLRRLCACGVPPVHVVRYKNCHNPGTYMYLIHVQLLSEY